jgi:hypothetical protein
MRLPKVGGILYAAQDKQNRIGEFMFMEHTQECASTNLEKLKKEAIEEVTLEGYQKGTNGKLVAVYDKTRESDLVIWEMRRIQ